MRAGHRARSSDRWRTRHDYNMGAPRGRDAQDQHDAYSRSRHGRYEGGSDDGARGRCRSPPRPRHRGDRDRSNHDWNEEQLSYENMYDEEHGRRRDNRAYARYDDYASRGADFSHSDRSGRSRSPRGRRYRSRSRSHTRDAGAPTDTVILEGLSHSITTAELREWLVTYSIAAENPPVDVRIPSSRGKLRAFVQFEDVSQATAFVKEHFPKLHLELRHSTDNAPDGIFEAYVHFARSRDEGDPRRKDWTCPLCDFFNYHSRTQCKSCGTSRTAEASWEQSLNGAADVADGADAVSQILVVHPLPSFVTEDMLAKNLKLLEKTEEVKSSANGPSKLKSTAPGADAARYGARPNSLHRVFLTREVRSGESFKYGFAEFWTLEDAAAAVAKFRLSRSFTVAGCAVTIAPTHMGVFLPEDREITTANEHMSFYPLFNPSLRVRYRDLRVFPSQLIVTSEPPNTNKDSGKGSRPAEDQDAEGRKQKKRLKVDGSAASSASTKKPIVMAGQISMWQRKHDELRGEQGDKSNNHGTAPAPEFTPKSDASKAPIKIALSNATKLGASSLDQLPTSGEKETITMGVMPGAAPTVGVSSSTDDPPQQDDQEETFVDRERLMCLICMRKYKSSDEVKIHEKSRNHKSAMEDADKVKAAQPRLAARDKRLQKQAEEESQMPQYRDRAKERRVIYNQPEKPSVPPPSSASSTTKPKSEAAAKPVDKTPAVKAVPSRGAGMLAKMGWTAGGGLGANGDGRTEAIATNAYQAGVGLGAEGGNLGDAVELAEKKTTNKYSDYLATAQDKARERYNQLN
ncbi:hypothetical protein E4U11_000294 [Claviceps purpurea]|nr:hypothetical protein E4U11_000294 [Claviceps purpurea]